MLVRLVLSVLLAATDHLVIVLDYDDAEVHIAGRADVSGFQTELDLSGILVKIIRTLGQLGYSHWELALDGIVSGVFKIELTCIVQEAQETCCIEEAKLPISPAASPKATEARVMACLCPSEASSRPFIDLTRPPTTCRTPSTAIFTSRMVASACSAVILTAAGFSTTDWVD
jgi:hypothetical protein